MGPLRFRLSSLCLSALDGFVEVGYAFSALSVLLLLSADALESLANVGVGGPDVDELSVGNALHRNHAIAASTSTAQNTASSLSRLKASCLGMSKTILPESNYVNTDSIEARWTAGLTASKRDDVLGSAPPGSGGCFYGETVDVVLVFLVTEPEAPD